ncbi:uncharacterized protein LOC126687636 [Mercurialis annua]|nr:uncharacterized protein LOC126687636 [Mercurialis annua]
MGGSMRCNTKWSEVDDVLFPINCGKQWHWILARLNIKQRCIYVYNSLRSARHERALLFYVDCYSELLPLFFEAIDLFSSRDDIDINSGPYAGLTSANPIRIEHVPDLPVQTDLDCGVHMFCAAEAFVAGKVLGGDFNIKEQRTRLASSFYTYAMWKDEYSAISEDEAPPKMNRND